MKYRRVTFSLLAASAAAAMLVAGASPAPALADPAPADWGVLTGTPTSGPAPTATTPPPSIPVPPPENQLACDVDYTVTSDWGTGFTAELVITNTGTETVGGWSIRLVVSGYLSAIWNGQYDLVDGVYHLGPANYSPSLAPGESYSLGVLGGESGSALGLGLTCAAQTGWVTASPG